MAIGKIEILLVLVIFLTIGVGWGIQSYISDQKVLVQSLEEKIQLLGANNELFISYADNLSKQAQKDKDDAEKEKYRADYLNGVITDVRQDNKKLRENIKILTEEKQSLQRLVFELNKTKKPLLAAQEFEVKQVKAKREGRGKAAFQELTEFLAEDKIDENQWSESYNCVSFTQDLLNNAEKQGIIGCMVVMDFSDDTRHAIASFPTSDEGMLFVEPQNDKIMKGLALGQNYCERADFCQGNLTITSISNGCGSFSTEDKEGF